MEDGSICKNNEYFDPYTGNCDPCKPICDVSDCTKLCPNYSTITTTTTDTPSGENNTSDILIICLLLVCISVVISLMIVLYKRYRQITCTCTRLQYKTPEDRTQAIQDTNDLLEEITLHT
ncbi:hypothetical protein CHS0354_020336 [Potamilus streckersoni]|uniref:Uncharacterized protein n=1 Tax=Potamilus streckersoni TaxID=2493646 RepID=A0AAE0SFJ7_9BIVA|nr:hypothetical protein CHS0354_020336 [Potamilus streckersoni]